MKLPPYLQKGDTIGITCPAGYMKLEKAQTCITVLQQWGYDVLVGKTLEERLPRNAHVVSKASPVVAQVIRQKRGLQYPINSKSDDEIRGKERRVKRSEHDSDQGGPRDCAGQDLQKTI